MYLIRKGRCYYLKSKVENCVIIILTKKMETTTLLKKKRGKKKKFKNEITATQLRK